LIHSIIGSTANPLALKDDVFSRWLQHSEHTAGDADALTSELRDFIDSIRLGRRPRVDGHDAVRAMGVADQVLSQMSLWSYQTGSDRADIAAAHSRAA
ncbi:MAG: hypothetical protein KDA85_12430, partial [Planctomycetaceae bacterium]|nr:hypothetical protein [Planctomycetaceae bacterium]